MKQVVITGGSNGIGESLVEVFAKHDYKVISIDITKPLNPLKGVIYEEIDLRDAESLKKFAKSCPKIHVLINNAARQYIKPFKDFSDEEIKEMILQKYLEDFTSLVKFAEDLIIAYMIANNEKIELIDFIDNKPIIWYESATGVSTSGNSKWQEKLREDCRNMFCFLKEKKIIPKWIYYSHFCNNKIIRMFIKLIHEPSIIAVFLKNGTEIKTNQGKAPYYDKLILKQIIGK